MRLRSTWLMKLMLIPEYSDTCSMVNWRRLRARRMLAPNVLSGSTFPTLRGRRVAVFSGFIIN
jgi:hypothetical protein